MNEQFAADSLVAFGDTVKAYLGEEEEGVVEALGLRFSNADEKDLAQDYFKADADFGPHKGNGMAATLNHRIPLITQNTKSSEAEFLKALAKKPLRNPVEAIPNEMGILVRHVLDLSDEYERTLFELAQKGKFRWSSGAPGHMVERDEDGGIKMWHIAEWAYTPTAAEPRLPRITPIKSLTDLPIEVATGATPVDIQPEQPTNEEGETDTPEDTRSVSASVTESVKGTETQSLVEVVGDNTMSEQTQPADFSPILSKLGEISDAFKALSNRVEAVEKQPVVQPGFQVEQPAEVKTAPAVLKTGRGDNETKAYAYWVKTGDVGAIKASNATDMNIGTSADGGYAVPTGHYQGIIARLDEDALYSRLGVMVIPGQGTTVNVPVDNEADGEFVSTNEAATFDLDAPAINQVQMTLVKYTKRVVMSYELMQDEDSRIMDFLNDFVGRGMAKTHNQLLITEALANGTASLTLDNASSITAAEIPELQYKQQAEYDDGSVWIMRRAIEGNLRMLTGNNWQFVNTPAGSVGGQPTLFGRPVYNSGYMGAGTTGTKSLLYGNFRYMGMRLAPDITVLRDPYSAAATGQVLLHYYFRTVYKVLQAEAIHYATQA